MVLANIFRSHRKLQPDSKVGPRANHKALEATLLLEPEVRAVDCAVVQLNYQLTTRAGPRWLSLPHVDILIRGGIISETAAARC